VLRQLDPELPVGTEATVGNDGDIVFADSQSLQGLPGPFRIDMKRFFDDGVLGQFVPEIVTASDHQNPPGYGMGTEGDVHEHLVLDKMVIVHDLILDGFLSEWSDCSTFGGGGG